MEEGRQYTMNPDVYQAASTGNLSFFKNLTDPSSTLLQVTTQKNTVLHVALQFEQFHVAEELVRLCPSLVYEKNSKGNTPLHVAARWVGTSSTVKLIIQKAKDQWDVEPGGQQLLSMVNEDGDTALQVAVRYENDDKFEIVRELMKEDPKLAKHVNIAGESALFLAVNRENYKMACHILNAAPDDCSYAGRQGMNVLHAIVLHTSCWNLKFVKSIVEFFIKPTIQSITGNLKFVKFIVEFFIKLTIQSITDINEGPLICPWETDAYREATYCRGLINSATIFCATLINCVWDICMLILYPLFAMRKDDVINRRLPRKFGTIPEDFVKEVMEKCPSTIGQGDHSGWTPLHIAAHMGNWKFVKLLLEKGNSFAYLKNNDGLSAFHIAAKEGHVEVMKEIIKKCPDIFELLDNRGRTALHVAAESGTYKSVRFFVGRPEFKVFFDEQDEEGNTFVHLAAICDQPVISLYLKYDRGVDLNVTNKEGFTTADNVLLHMNSLSPSIFWSIGARPSLRGALLRMGIQKLDPRRQPKLAGTGDGDGDVTPSNFVKQVNETNMLDPRKKPKLAGTGDGDGDGNGTNSNFVKHVSETNMLDPRKKPKLEGTGDGNGDGDGTPSNFVKQVSEANMLVATLIATVTFTAAFTVPGGYNQNESKNGDDGLAVLRKKTAFGVFLIANTLAFGLSTISVFVRFLASATKMEAVLHREVARRTSLLIYWSIGALLVAFIAGTYTMVPHSLGIAVVIILCCCFLSTMFFPV